MDSEIQGIIALLQAYTDSLQTYTDGSNEDKERTWQQADRLKTYESIKKTFQGTPLERTIDSYLLVFQRDPDAIKLQEKNLINAIVKDLKDKESADNLKADAYALNLEEKVAQYQESLTKVPEGVSTPTPVSIEQEKLSAAREKIQERIKANVAQAEQKIETHAQETGPAQTSEVTSVNVDEPATAPGAMNPISFGRRQAQQAATNEPQPTATPPALQESITKATEQVAALPLSSTLIEVERTFEKAVTQAHTAEDQRYIKAAAEAAAAAFGKTQKEVYEEYRGKVPEAVNSATTRVIEHIDTKHVSTQNIFELNEANYEGLQALSEISATTNLESAAQLYREAATNYLKGKNIINADQYVEAMTAAAASEIVVGQKQYGIDSNQRTDFHDASAQIVEKLDAALKNEGQSLQDADKQAVQKRIASVLDSQTENGEIVDVQRAENKVRFELNKVIQQVEQDNPGAQVKVSSVDFTDTIRDSLLDTQAQIINRKATAPQTTPVDMFSATFLEQNPDFKVMDAKGNPSNQPIPETQAEKAVRQGQNEWRDKVKQVKEQYKSGEIDWPEYQRQLYSTTNQRDTDNADINVINTRINQGTVATEEKMADLRANYESQTAGPKEAREYLKQVKDLIAETGDITTVGSNIDKYSHDAEDAIRVQLESLRSKLPKRLSEDDANNIINNLISENIQALSETQQITQLGGIISRTIRTELPKQLQQYGITKYNDSQFDATISEITTELKDDPRIKTAATLSSVKALIPFADQAAIDIEAGKRYSTSQDKFWESFPQSLSPEEKTNISKDLAGAIMGTSIGNKSPEETHETIEKLIIGAVADSGLSIDTSKEPHLIETIRKNVAQAQQKYAQSGSDAEVEQISKQIIEDVNKSLTPGQGRTSQRSFLMNEYNERVDLDSKMTILEANRESTQFEIADTIQKLIPNLKKEQYDVLAKEAVATMYGRVYFQKVQEQEDGKFLSNDDGSPKYKILRTDHNGNPIYKFKVANSPGLLADFFDALDSVDEDKIKKMSVEERTAFFESKKAEHKEYLTKAAAVTIFGLLKERDLLSADIESKLNDLRLGDLYSLDQRAYLAKEAKANGKSADLNRKITLQEAMEISLAQHGLHFDEFLKLMEETELQKAKGLDKQKELPFMEQSAVMYRKSKAKNFVGNGIGNVKFWFNPHAAQSIISREILDRPLKTVMWGLGNMGVSTEYSLPMVMMNVGLPFAKTEQYFRSDVDHFFRRTGIPIDIMIDKGYVPDEIYKRLSGSKRRELDRLIREGQAIKKVKGMRENHKNYAKLMDFVTGADRTYRATARLEAVSYIIHGNPGGLFGAWMDRGSNLLTNLALEKAGWVLDYSSGTPTYVLPAWVRTKKKLKEHTAIIALKIKNSRIVKSFTVPIAKMIEELMASTVGAGLKLLGKGIGFLVKSLTVVLGVISAIDGVAQKILDFLQLGGAYRKLKQILKLYFTYIVYQFLAPIASFLGLFSGSGAAATTVATTAVPISTSVGMSALPSAASSINLGMINSTPLTVNIASNVLGGAANILNGMKALMGSVSNLSFAQLFAAGQSVFASLFAWAGPLGFAGLTVLTFGIVTTFIFHLGLLNALKDPIDTLIGNSVAYSNPLQMRKSASPFQLPESGYRETTFKINISAPPCDQTMTVTDNIPQNMAYVANSAYSIPSQGTVTTTAGIIKGIAMSNTATQLTWTISLDPAQVKADACASSGEDLENVNALGDEPTSVAALNLILENHKMKGLGQVFYNAAKANNINPLLVIGIYYFESQLGDTGIGRPQNIVGGVRQFGCFNPGGTRGGNQQCPSADENGDGTPDNGLFRLFANYEESIDDTFRNLRQNYLNTGLNTVDLIINKYTPLSDNNGENNPNSKRIVRCTLAYKTTCGSDIGGADYSGAKVEVEVGFKASVLDAFTKGCITNTASAVIGPTTSTASTIVSVGGEACSGSGEFCSNPPADTNELVSKLNAAKIYPTNQTRTASWAPANGGWTRNQYELLWKLACRTTQSPTFMDAAAGNDGFEIQRIKCLPNSTIYAKCPNPPEHRAYYKGFQSYSEQPGTRLLLITDKIIGQTDGLFIHLVAHEMGHSAQAAGGALGTNPKFLNFKNNVFQPSKSISSYAASYVGEAAELEAAENHAEAIGFYLTNGENFSQYFGYDQLPNGGDFKQEAAAQAGWLRNYYDHLKNEFFDGKEFDNNLP
ncbi:MAG: hypothetical protein M3Q44_01170 [bacterium]|nr:hypothetical protein [bacterium]